MENNNSPTTVTGINDLCNSIWKKQMENQMHIPESFDGMKVIDTCRYEIEEMVPCKLCMCVVKANNEWHACNEEGEQLPINSLGVHSLHNVEEVLLEVWEGILEWEAQWD